MKHAKIKAAEDEREQLEEEINSFRTDLRLARSNTKIYGEKERGEFLSPRFTNRSIQQGPRTNSSWSGDHLFD